MKLTMKKIAEDLEISQMTISRYFNNGYVSKKTKEKIEAYLKVNDYEPNFFASNLKSKSNIIGFIAPRINSVTTNELVEGILNEIAKNNYKVMFAATRFDLETEEKALKEFKSLNVKGIIAIGSNTSINNMVYEKIPNSIIIGMKSETNPFIKYPEEEALTEIIEKAVSKKIKDIVYIHSKRMLSYRLVIIKKIIQNYPELNFKVMYKEDFVEETEKKLYICATDSHAYHLYEKIENRNQIGKSINIVGIGGYKTNKLISPSLTSICFPYQQVGELAVNKIINDNYENATTTYNIDYQESFK